MHSEIKKFWEDSGYKIVVDVLQGTYPDDLWRFYWVLVRDKRQIKFAGMSDNQPQGTREASCSIHFMDGEELSETEMLRIIRLKAFL